MTGCYSGTNDYDPFFSGGSQRAEPETDATLAEIHGPLTAG